MTQLFENPWVMLAVGLLVEHFVVIVGRLFPATVPLESKKAEVVAKVESAVAAKGVVV